MNDEFDFSGGNFAVPDYGAGAHDVGLAMDPAGGAALAIFGGMMIFMILISLSFYVYLAVCLMKLAQKTDTENAWFAWVPILNVILMLQIAKKPLWWLLLFFIPGINLVFIILVWMEIAKLVGKPEWWGILTIVPLVNLVVPGYLAFSSSDYNGPEPASVTEEGQQ